MLNTKEKFTIILNTWKWWLKNEAASEPEFQIKTLLREGHGILPVCP